MYFGSTKLVVVYCSAHSHVFLLPEPHILLFRRPLPTTKSQWGSAGGEGLLYTLQKDDRQMEHEVPINFGASSVWLEVEYPLLFKELGYKKSSYCSAHLCLKTKLWLFSFSHCVIFPREKACLENAAWWWSSHKVCFVCKQWVSFSLCCDRTLCMLFIVLWMLVIIYDPFFKKKNLLYK